jgi:hypothetical protein
MRSFVQGKSTSLASNFEKDLTELARRHRLQVSILLIFFKKGCTGYETNGQKNFALKVYKQNVSLMDWRDSISRPITAQAETFLLTIESTSVAYAMITLFGHFCQFLA